MRRKVRGGALIKNHSGATDDEVQTARGEYEKRAKDAESMLARSTFFYDKANRDLRRLKFWHQDPFDEHVVS